MALVRNELPILEYDGEQQALLMPNRQEHYTLPRRAVLFFHAEAVAAWAQAHDAVQVGEFVNITKATPLYRVAWQGWSLGLCAAPLGASAAAQLLDFLIACGCTEVIAGGSCGALEPLAEGAFLVPERALRAEGASYHYLPPARWVETDAALQERLCRVLARRGLPVQRCATWSTDGFFRETPDMVAARRAEGCAVVEMECAALAACARFRRIRLAQLLYTADSLAGLAHEDRGWGENAVETALELCLDAAAEP